MIKRGVITNDVKKITRENTVLLFLTAIMENLSFLDISGCSTACPSSVVY